MGTIVVIPSHICNSSCTAKTCMFKSCGSTLPTGGYKHSITEEEKEINTYSYKGYYVANNIDFDNMEILAEKQEGKKFKTYFCSARFNYATQLKIEKIAKNYGYTGVVYHPIIYITDGNQKIYFDWLKEGFSIRNKPIFDIYKTEYIGDHSVSDVMNACKNNSMSCFDLYKNNCMTWGNNVKYELGQS